MIGRYLALAAVLTLVLASRADAQTTAAPPEGVAPPLAERHVRATILPGSPPVRPPPPAPVAAMPNGEISLNFAGVEAAAVTKAILGDTLGLPFAVDPAAHGPITVISPHPLRRGDVLAFFEQSLTTANLVLVNRAGIYTVLPAITARGEAPVVVAGDAGFGNETVTLQFVNAEEMRKLLDPLVPNAVSITDPAHNTLVLSGSTTQRRALRELVAQFDVDWLRGMSFALLIPERTDARLIAPELEKLLNAPGAPTAGVVRLIAMTQLNGILAISAQPQYLYDVKRFVEILDREGESAERTMFVYHVQSGRAADLAKVLNSAFGISTNSGATGAVGAGGAEPFDLVDHSAPSAATVPPSSGLPPGIGGGLAPRSTPPATPGAIGSSPPASASDPAGPTTITADENNNALVVFATPRNYALISDALRKLDVPPLQVMIDASISEVTLNHNLQYGIQWAFQAGRLGGALSQGTQSTQTIATGGVTTTLPNGVTTTTPTNTSTQIVNPGPLQNFPGLSFLYQGNGVSATLNALASVTDVTVLSSPKLMVLNNRTATIEVGDQVPISTGSAVSTITSSAPIVNSIEYRDTGIILKITPRVNSGGLVLLDIAQEVSDVLPQSGSSAIDSPTIEQRKIATSVAVQDGETIALGGLIRNEVQKGRSTIPLLGDIPILGHLFGDTTGGLIRTELVVLLTPHVVRTAVDARAVTEELRDKIHLAAPPPPPKPAGQRHGS